jgi:hypothetical protein
LFLNTGSMQEARALIEAAVAAKRFSGAKLARQLIPMLRSWPTLRAPLDTIWSALGRTTASATTIGLVRAVFLIELVNEKVTSTKFEHRWTPRLAGDPRGCPFDECCTIFESLAGELSQSASNHLVRDTLERFRRFRMLPYETPIDYVARATASPIHHNGNLAWIWDDPEISHTLLLRERIRDSGAVDSLANVFLHADKKTKVKTYLTDRALTGISKTNREKRWEAHPASVQFAFRRDCLKIEHKLLSQICHFAGFPLEIRAALLLDNAILDMELPARCPITRDALDFSSLRASLESPEWGQSAFQVGHLNPLKGPGAGREFGHTPANIAWISANGNRVQGSLSYADTIALLERIQANYAQHPPLSADNLAVGWDRQRLTAAPPAPLPRRAARDQ